MEFRKYQHIERFGTTEVENIELGKCYIFPKIDGTNSSIWNTLHPDNTLVSLGCGSRKRELTLDSDNAGFMLWAINQKNILGYLIENPTHRLFGEWLVPHSLKTYRDDAWRRFYVFDVAIDKDDAEITHDNDSTIKYLSYDEYQPLLEKYGIDYIQPICTIENASFDQLNNQLMKNVFLIEDGNGVGEGIVIKNYDFKNKYGRQTWAKIVTSEFKDKHTKEMGVTEMKGKKIIELEIAKKYVTAALCEKVKSKIEIDNDGFGSRDIPRLLNTIFYDIVKEETWNFVKDFKNPVVDFKRLQHFIFAEIKNNMPNLF